MRLLKSKYFIFIIPILLFTLVVSIYPTINSIIMSFNEVDFSGAKSFVGLSNYLDVLKDKMVWDTTINMFVFLVASVIGHLGIGLIIALLLFQKINTRFRDISRGLILIPWAIAPVIVATIWRIVYKPQFSPLVPLLDLFGKGGAMSFDVLSSPETALWGVIIANIWSVTPFYMLMILARMQNIPQTMYEAAQIDGANSWQKFIHITFPQLKGILGTLMIFDLVGTSIYFDLVWVMTGGGPARSSEVLATYIYKQAFQQFNFGKASAAGVLLFILVMGLTILFTRLMREEL